MSYRYKAGKAVEVTKLERGWLVASSGNAFGTERRAFVYFKEVTDFLEDYYTHEGSVER